MLSSSPTTLSRVACSAFALGMVVAGNCLVVAQERPSEGSQPRRQLDLRVPEPRILRFDSEIQNGLQEGVPPRNAAVRLAQDAERTVPQNTEDAPPTLQNPTQNENYSNTMPGGAPYGAQMMGGGPPTPARHVLGESVVLREFESIGKITRVIASRSGSISVDGATTEEGIDQIEFTLDPPREFVEIKGRTLGKTNVTLIGESGTPVRTQIEFTPDASYLQTLIEKQFPEAIIKISSVGPSVMMLNGTVETPSEIDQIVLTVRSFLGKDGYVVNAVKVAGATQVQLEVVVARVDRTELRRLGIDFQVSGPGGYGGTSIGTAGVPPAISSGVVGEDIPGINTFKDIGGAGSVIPPTATIFAGANDGVHQFFTQLEALRSQRVVKILARPTLVTMSGQSAEFLAGGEQPYPEVGALGNSGATFKKFGVRVNFLPVVIGPGKLRLDLVPEVSTLGEETVIAGSRVPSFQTQRIHTTVEMFAGQTLVLAGMLESQSQGFASRIPFLGDLGILGIPFRGVEHSARETELMIVVTPRFVSPLDPHEYVEQLPGNESRSPTDKELYLHGQLESPACEVECPPLYEDVGRGALYEPAPYGAPQPSFEMTPQPTDLIRPTSHTEPAPRRKFFKNPFSKPKPQAAQIR
jgi:pilus assembly protein CpaC